MFIIAPGPVVLCWLEDDILAPLSDRPWPPGHAITMRS